MRLTISEATRREVLTRLLQLNHERDKEEVRQGLYEKKGKQGSKCKRGARRKGEPRRKEMIGRCRCFRGQSVRKSFHSFLISG